jgi:hypothetical protein
LEPTIHETPRRVVGAGSLKRWDQRPIEIRNLFNPAFCGLVLFRAIRAFEDDAKGMPFSMTLLILPLRLERDSREILARSNRSYFLKIVAAHPEMLVGFPKRASDLVAFLPRGARSFDATRDDRRPGGRSLEETVPDGVRKTISGTPESISCQRVAKFLGKEFAQIGDRATTYTTLGVRP